VLLRRDVSGEAPAVERVDTIGGLAELDWP
jgi:hypothetical protein